MKSALRRFASRWVVAVGLVAAAALTVSACARPSVDEGVSAEEFFSGKTIEFVVPFPPGGGTDVAARLIAPLLTDFIPGSPRIQIVNIEGGASVVGSNEFSTTGGDGLSLLMTSAATSNAVVFGDPAVRFEWSDFIPVAALPSGGVQYVNAATGIDDPSGLFEVEQLTYGGVTPGGGEMLRLLGFHVLDLPVTEVFGYEGRGAIQIAFQQGETNFDGQAAQAYIENVLPLVDAGEAVPVYTQGFIVDGQIERDPAFPDLPHLAELYEEFYGEDPSGELWSAYEYMLGLTINLAKPVWIHGDAPDVAVEAVKQAFTEMAESDDVATVADLLGYEILVGDALENSVSYLTDVPEETIEFLVDFARDEYGASLATG